MKFSIPKDNQFLRGKLFYTREAMLGVWVLPARIRDNSEKHQFRYLRSQFKGRRVSFFSKIMRFLIAVVVVSSVFLIVFVNAPNLYYRLSPASAVAIIADQAGSPLGGKFNRVKQAIGADTKQTADADTKQMAGVGVTPTPTPYEPATDPSLPDGDWLEIPRIGVRSSFEATQDPAEALKTGLWLVPEFGEPGDRDVPMIVAAHRFGWKWWWKSDYWQYHSFYRLPETEPGDLIEVISNHRKWIYEIYAGEENDEITDYDADLILYTCKFLNSPIRHVRYARLIDPTVNTQE